MNWQVYMIRCSDQTLYTGITNDLERRWQQHASQRGARYFRGRAPIEIVYVEPGHDRSSASRREVDIKKLQRADKERLIRSQQNLLHCTTGPEVGNVNEQTD
jgi:putative endonuclease